MYLTDQSTYRDETRSSGIDITLCYMAGIIRKSECVTANQICAYRHMNIYHASLERITLSRWLMYDVLPGDVTRIVRSIYMAPACGTDYVFPSLYGLPILSTCTFFAGSRLSLAFSNYDPVPCYSNFITAQLAIRYTYVYTSAPIVIHVLCSCYVVYVRTSLCCMYHQAVACT